jgi:hypothetical protein
LALNGTEYNDLLFYPGGRRKLPVRRCSRCQELKPLNSQSFVPDTRRSSGFTTWCRACHNAYQNDRRKARLNDPRYRDKALERSRRQVAKWKAKPEGRAYVLRGSAKHRAKKYGVPFDLTLEWLQVRIEAGRCEVTGLPFNMDSNKRNTPFAPSVDRINSAGGYTEDNCRLVLFAVNAALGDWGEAVALDIIQAWLANRIGT